MTEEQALKELKRVFKSEIPTGKAIAEMATEGVLERNNADNDWIKNNFSQLVEEIQEEGYRIYLKEERKAADIAFRAVFSPMLVGKSDSDFLTFLNQNFWALDRFFLGLTQGRRPRAGGTFEHLTKHLFERLEYPFSYQAVINGQPDFLLPSEAHFRNNAMDCIIFTVKRTLRERWRQIVTEGIRGHLFFLATIDENIAQRDLPEMLSSRIYAVVPKRIKESVSRYQNAQNVITFETFFEQHLDPAISRWKSNGVVG